MANAAVNVIIWAHDKFEPVIKYLPDRGTWYCLIREGRSGEFRSLEGPEPLGHPTPGDALTAASALLDGLETARHEALAVEVVTLLTASPPRLRRAIITEMAEPSAPESSSLWEAQRDDGTWTDPVPSPYKAVKIAKEYR